ncbi:MAG: PD-(D/E)XK nuclease family protein [Prevotellaceae bacterium]|nr:PD-(D/E)XK nuclease family protein [Prevotellaceae bacterium]
MQPFLYRIAELFYYTHGNRISRFSFVFPNRRAGLFFQKYLSSFIDKPVFSPGILTINDCFTSVSPRQVVDRLSLLFRVYNIYLTESKSNESFDTFAHWGEMLLSDFDEVDKQLIDARQLFVNVTELKRLDYLFDSLSPEQKKVIKRFWDDFSPVKEGKKAEEEFIATWKLLYPMYAKLQEELSSEKLATEGMIFRDVSKQLEAGGFFEQWEEKQFVFVGFNALNRCEKTLFKALQKAGKADFYWDYEAATVRDPNNKASFFYYENQKAFPSKYPLAASDYPLKEKKIELIAVPSEVGQTKQVYEILRRQIEREATEDWLTTAVVLPDENMLIPLLYDLPDEIAKVNVTMGFPLKATPVSGLIEHVFELQRRSRLTNGETLFYHKNVSTILNHQYIASACKNKCTELTKKIKDNNLIYVNAVDLGVHPLLQKIFTTDIDPTDFVDYLLKILDELQFFLKAQRRPDSKAHRIELDYLYQYHIVLKRLSGILKGKPDNIKMTPDTVIRFIRQMTANLTIPFVGEPLEGLQIMGVLETRGLDFENLIITSFNEGIYPKRTAPNSFIPYNLRKAFNLPATEEQDAVLAYNFYRLINRAKNIYFLYDSRTEGMQTGEVSRYLYQLYYHYGVRYESKVVSFDIGFDNPPVLKIAKTAEIQEKLSAFLSSDDRARALSASAINDYIDCPLLFYLTRIEKVKKPDEVKETIEGDMFGTIFHTSMEHLYKPYIGKMMQGSDIDKIIKNDALIKHEIAKSFSTNYFKKKEGVIVRLEGNYLLTARVIEKYILQTLEIDKKSAPFRYVAAEEECDIRFPIHGGQSFVNITGFIDRIDEKDGKLRILDYKTGSNSRKKQVFETVESLFEHNNDKRGSHALQTMLYALLYKEKAGTKTIVPEIYYIREIYKSDFDTRLKCTDLGSFVADFSEYENEFTALLGNCLEEIFDPDIPFVQSDSTKPCAYCSFVGVCKR